MSNDTQVLRATLETALARIEDMLADDDGQAFKEARKFLESARQLSEQPGFVMVPVEPTWAMAGEFFDELEGGPDWGETPDDDEDKLEAFAEFSKGYRAMLAARPLTASPTAPTEASEPGGYPAPYRCLKPHCPPICSGCNRAIPVTDTAKMLMVKVLDSLAVDDLGNPFEEGDHMAVDEARAWLCDTTPPPAPVLSEAEIEDAVKAARHPSGTLTPTDLARAIEQAIGRRGAK